MKTSVWFLATLTMFLQHSRATNDCRKNRNPNLRGDWFCDPTWVTESSSHVGIMNIMDGSNSTYWRDETWDVRSSWSHVTSYVIFQLPEYYVMRGIALRSQAAPGSVKVFRLSYWSDVATAEYKNGDAGSAYWVVLGDYDLREVPDQKFMGFSRLSRHWKLNILSTDDGEAPVIQEVAFYIVADVHVLSNIQLQISNVQTSSRNFGNNVVNTTGNTCNQVVSPVPVEVVQKYDLDTSFYHKYTSSYGIPVMGSSALDDRALQRACYVLRFMLADNPNIRYRMFMHKGRVAIIGRAETVPMVPEFRIFPNFTARGAGGTYQIPVNVGAEENVLCLPEDRYDRNQDILMHEIAHGVHLIAAFRGIPDFDRRLRDSYDEAKSKGLWHNTYAGTNYVEYFAEGVQSFFNQQREGPAGGDGIQNDVNTRSELENHDNRLFLLIKEIFPCCNMFIPRCDDVDQTRGLEHVLEMDCKATKCNGGVGVVRTGFTTHFTCVITTLLYWTGLWNP